MSLIVKLIILTIAICGFIALVCSFIAYCPSSLIACIFRSIFEKDEYDIFLSFKEFTDYYWLNPEAYYFTSDAYACDTTTYVKVKRIVNYNEIYIGFETSIDYYLFYKWKKKLDREKYQLDREKYHNNRNSEIQKNTRKFVELIQKDIDKLREQSNKELDEANKLLKGIKND